MPGYKLPGWDPTWGTCLEQSLCKINSRRLKMKKRFLVNFRRSELGWSSEIEKSIRKPFLVRFLFGRIDKYEITWSNLLLLDLIPEGLREVGFFEKNSSRKILYYRRLMANLRRPTWDVRIWILGMLLILDPHLIHSPDFLFDIYSILEKFPKSPKISIKTPEKKFLRIEFAWCGNC